jgi:hypothetical protein
MTPAALSNKFGRGTVRRALRLSQSFIVFSKGEIL